MPWTGGDPILVTVTQEDFDMPKVQRDYYGLDLYLDHPFDGTWSGRIDYTFSRSWGNAEGQVRSDIGQTDTSKTEDWDYWQLMSGARGYLANHRRHSLKARGAWQVTPEVTVGGTLAAAVRCSRSPAWVCLVRTRPIRVAVTVVTITGAVARSATPGATTTPWLKQLDLNAVYRPMFADQKLAFKAADVQRDQRAG